MAADWIKMRADLFRDPAVVFIARACKLDAFAVVGRLHAVWAWADAVTEDGIVEGVDAALIDEIAGRKGFALAMSVTPRSPWLVIGPAGVSFPHFDRHNGDSAKRRAQEAHWKRRTREADKLRTDGGDSSAECPDNVHEMSTCGVDSKPTRRDETREDERTTATATDSPADAGPPPRPAKPPRKPSGVVQETLSWFAGRYAELRGSPYPITAKDGVAVARLLKTFTVADVRLRLERGLTVDDDWLDRTDRSITVLAGQINKPALRGIESNGHGPKTQLDINMDVLRRAAAKGRDLGESE